MPYDHVSTDHLIAKLQQSLPFHAFVTKHARSAYESADRRPVRNKQRIEISRVLDGGNEGGVVCFADLNGGKRALAISITHLRFDTRHPAYKEVRSYQINRAKHLAAERLQTVVHRNNNDRATVTNG